MQRQAHDWAALAKGIIDCDEAAITELYGIFGGALRATIARRLGNQDADDHVHECVIMTVTALRNGRLTEPGRLIGYIQGLVRNYANTQIALRIKTREQSAGDPDAAFRLISSRALSPEAIAMRHEKIDAARCALSGLKPRDREILNRFYLLGQSDDMIRREMGLTWTGFRNLKQRAKLALVNKLHGGRGRSGRPARIRTGISALGEPRLIR